MSPDERFDVLIVGGSFAGLSAAIQLGRARRSVAVLDAGEPRNRFAAHSHGFLGQDGRPPHEILAEARGQVERYPTVRILRARATDATVVVVGFEVRTPDSRLSARRLILATGVRDVLPEVEGLRERWGEGVFHCPYCHGYEVRGRPLGVLGADAAAVHQAILLRDWSSDVVVLTNGRPPGEGLEKLERRGIRIDERPIARLVGEGRSVSRVEFADGDDRALDGLLVRTDPVPNGTLHEALGCRTAATPMGTILEVDAMQETTVSGVFAAGDLARAPHAVSFAVAGGTMAAVAAHRSLLTEDYGL